MHRFIVLIIVFSINLLITYALWGHNNPLHIIKDGKFSQGHIGDYTDKSRIYVSIGEYESGRTYTNLIGNIPGYPTGKSVKIYAYGTHCCILDTRHFLFLAIYLLAFVPLQYFVVKIVLEKVSNRFNHKK